MILIDEQFRKKNRNAIRLARQDKFTIKHLDTGLYFVARKEAGHGKYIVSIKETKSGIFATCRQIYGAACQSYSCCAHIAAWYLRAIADGRRLQRKERAA